MAAIKSGEDLRISGRLLTRNWALNLMGWTIPISVALFAIPYVVHGLGAEQFGILSIASALLGYFGIFDLGLGRATTKFVAETLARGDFQDLPKVVWTSVWSQALFGLVGTMLTIGSIPFLVDRFLKITPNLIGETKTSLFILSGSLCVILMGNAFRGVLEAAQRFDIVNYVKVPLNASMFLLPAVGVFFHLRLSGIVWLLVAARIAATAAYLGACLNFLPALKGHFAPHRVWFRPLFVYGGWVTLSNFITPLLAYVDRFLIGSLVSMSAVGYYSAPYEAINRAWVLPATLAATIFPAFTSLDTGGSRERLEELCARSLKSLLLVSAPALLVLAVLARQVLRWWLGSDFAAHSTSVLQILAVGMLFNSIALIPFSLLQGVGRPDLTGIFSLIEFIFQVGACWWLVRRFGIAGAALAWTLRSLLDGILMFGAVFWLNSVSLASLLRHGIDRTLLAIAGLGISFAIVWRTGSAPSIQAVFIAILVLLFAVISWIYLLDNRDRSLISVTAANIRLAFAKLA